MLGARAPDMLQAPPLLPPANFGLYGLPTDWPMLRAGEVRHDMPPLATLPRGDTGDGPQG